MKDMMPAVLFLLIGSAALLFLSVHPKPGRSVIAMFPDRLPDQEVFSRVVKAGWLPVRFPDGFPGRAVIAAPGQQPGSLGDHGAWLVIDALWSKGCL